MISQQKYCKNFASGVSIFQNYETQTFIFKITKYYQKAVDKMDDKDWNSTLNNYLGLSIMQHCNARGVLFSFHIRRLLWWYREKITH